MRQNKRHIRHHAYFKEKLGRMGLYQVAQMGSLELDRALITALVERWRPECHTFHMPTGEKAPLLQVHTTYRLV